MALVFLLLLAHWCYRGSTRSLICRCRRTSDAQNSSLKNAVAGHAIWKDVASEGKPAAGAASGGTSCVEAAFAHEASSSSSEDPVSADSVVENSAAEDSVVADSESETPYTEPSQGFYSPYLVPNARSWLY